MRPIQQIICPLGLNATPASINNIVPFFEKNVNTRVKEYIKKNNLKMTADEFIEWASNKQLEQEENMTPQQKELYDLIDKIQKDKTILKESDEKYNTNSFPKDIKDIKNMNEFLRKAMEDEADRVWKQRLRDAYFSGSEMMLKESPLKYKRQLVQQYLNYKLDNQGRVLSQGQQEFFKNSKVRDENGRLMVVYHGTPTGKFNVYDTSKLGTTTKAKDSTLGIHLTDNLDLANQYKDYISDDIKAKAKEYIDKKYDLKYGIAPFDMVAKLNKETEKLAKQRVKRSGEVKKQYINIEKPLSIFADYGRSEQRLADDIVYAATGSRDITEITDAFESNMDMLLAVQQNFNNELGELKDELAKPDAVKRIQELGYDGVILPIQKTDVLGLEYLKLNTKGNEYIVFNSNQIKNVDNINPTSDENIMREDSENFEINKTTDNTGKELTREQQIYFKDSKVRDEEGKLLRVYHGTEANAGIPEQYRFTVFDLDRAGNHGSTLGDGFYFTENRDRAQKYYAHTKGNVYEVYLNLKNPFEKARNLTFSEAIQEINPEYDINRLYLSSDSNSSYKRFDGAKLRQYLIDNGYDGVSLEGTYVAFYPEQIKDISNSNPTSNPDILKEEYTQLTIDGFNNEPENNLSKENWNKYKEAKNKTTETLKRDGTKVEISKRKFSKDFVDNGYIDLNGKTVKNAADVADMAQIFRNPKYETFRVIYMQGNTIVGQEAVSSKIPNNTSIFVKDDSQARGLYKIENRMQRLGADGYYLIHNHPTGVARASEADINVTKIIDKKIKGFLGHVIINSGTYSLIERCKAPGFTDALIWNDEIKIENYKPDDIDNMLSKEAWANTQIRNKDDILNLAYDLKNNPNYSSLIMADAKQKARIILDIPNSFLNMKLGQINGYIRNVAKENGASHAYIATQNSDVFDKMFFSNALQDCILYNIDENGNMVAKQSKTTDAPGKSIFQAYGSMALRANEKIDDIYSELYNKQSTQTEITPPIDNNLKQRKHYKSIIESNYTSDEAKAISRQLLKSDEYVPESNNKQLEVADKRIQTAGADSELNSLMSRAVNGGVIKSDDIAVGERLIQYYSKIGDKAKLQEAIQATAMAGTTAGQTVQAFALLNHQTPEGQAIWLQRSVEKMNNDLKKQRGNNADQFDLTPDMIDKIVNSSNAEELQTNLDEVYEELGQQVSKTTLQKIDAWRYFSMLANPKTHIRNIAGNTAMGKVQGIKNKVAGAIEGAVAKVNPEMERTHTIIPASEEVKQFAKNDIKNVADRLELNSNKYNPKTRLENSMRTFERERLENTLGKLFDLNDKLLEAEDGWGLKAAYTKSLAEYMTANKLTPDNITDKQLAQARNYAVEQAKEATFHQASALASAINQFSQKNKLTKFITDAVLPFKKTPINIAKAGLEYSPVGLAKSAIYDTVQLRKGNITVNKYIDNISKGLTGTGIAVLGYALAKAGILKASGSDDKDKENFDKDRGNQTYSIKIGDNTYSLDWLAPSAIPLFIGAEIFNAKQRDNENKTSSSDDDTSYSQAIKSATNILDGFTNAMNPMTEMSMLSGLTSALKSYDGDSSKMLANLSVNAANSYVNQFIPTALGQVAKTTDEYERSTTSTKTGTLPKAIDSTKNYAMSKIPGLRQKLPIKNDIWGNEVKQSDNVVERALRNAVLPYTKKTISNTDVDNALTKLYDETGESSVIPDTINKKITINGQDYRFTNEEYVKYKKDYGTTSYELINNLVNTKAYDKLSTEQQQKAIENIYSYAKERNKVDYAKKNNIDIEPSTLYNTMEELKKKGGNQSEYLSYLSQTGGISKESEKNKILADSNYNNKTKEIIYSNGTGSDDSLYNIMKNTGININEYLKYKTQTFESDKTDDGTTSGKTVSGSKKAKVYDYVNKMNITYNQRLLLLGTQYSLTNAEQSKLAQYVNELKISKAEKLSIYEKLQGFKVYKDGRVTW